MTTTITEDLEADPELAQSSSVVAWIALLIGLSLVVGGLAAVFWSGVVDLPAYTIQADESAVIDERGLTQIVGADVWYVITGALVASGLGIVTWKWFKPLGWGSALLAVGSGLVAGLVCWKLGELMGPGPFAERLANAERGAAVPVSLELRSWSALAVWGFAAVTPVLLASSLGPDDEDPAPRKRAKKTAREEDAPVVDELGVVTTEEG